MKKKNKVVLGEEVIIRPLEHKDVNDLIKVGFSFSKGALNPSLRHKILQSVRLLPNATRLVAYYVEEKRAIGFLSLVKRTPLLYSIQYVFTDPRFRRVGVAAKLLSYALHLAKEKAVKKCFLDVVENNIPAINLYEKMGFVLLTRAIEAQGRLSKHLSENRDRFALTATSIKGNRELLYDIYQRCMGPEWINFFETRAKNFDSRYAYRFRRFFCKKVFINDLRDSLTIIFKRPFLDSVTLELYSVSDVMARMRMLQDIFKILHKEGVDNITIMLFGIDNNESLHLFKEWGLNAFPLQFMGRRL